MHDTGKEKRPHGACGGPSLLPQQERDASRSGRGARLPGREPPSLPRVVCCLPRAVRRTPESVTSAARTPRREAGANRTLSSPPAALGRPREAEQPLPPPPFAGSRVSVRLAPRARCERPPSDPTRRRRGRPWGCCPKARH